MTLSTVERRAPSPVQHMPLERAGRGHPRSADDLLVFAKKTGQSPVSTRNHLAGTEYASSFKFSFWKPIRFRMPFACSTISGCPHRYPTLFAPVSPHWSAYLRITSSTRPTSPFQLSSSQGRLTVKTERNHGACFEKDSNSSR